MAARKKRAAKKKAAKKTSAQVRGSGEAGESRRDLSPATPPQEFDPLGPMKLGEIDLRGATSERVIHLRTILVHLVMGRQVPVAERDWMDHRIHNARRVRNIRGQLGRGSDPGHVILEGDVHEFVAKLLPLPGGG